MAIFSAICLLFAFTLWRLRPRASGNLRLIAINGRETALTVRKAESWMQRQVGLLNHADLPLGVGLVLEPSRGVHTTGMAFALDVVFYDRQGRILDIVCNVGPGCRALKGPRGSFGAMEFRAGTISSVGTIQIGDRVQFR